MIDMTVATLKREDQMDTHELFNLRHGLYATGRIIKGQIYYRVD